MQSSEPSPRELAQARLRAAALPAPLGDVLARLAAAGFDAALVGGCVRDLARGKAVRDYDVATAAPVDALLRLFPRAIPTGLRHGTVMVPTPAGPVDVTSYRAGPRLEDDLAHRDFRVNALAFRPAAGVLIDPFGGSADLTAGVLGAVGDAAARFAEDPLRALRAARLVAEVGLVPEPALERAIADAAATLSFVARERVRQELTRLLVAPGAGDALGLLRRTGLEAVLVPGAPPDAAAVVPRLPADLALRLAAWLRGTRARSLLARWRIPRRVSDEVAALLRDHPVERDVDPGSPAALRRLLQRCGAERVDDLVRLRRADLVAAAREQPAYAAGASQAVDALAAALERLRASGPQALGRLDLALDGAGVMAALGCGPGPRVGAALRYLTDRVLDDPSRNTPERLRALLAAWAA
jgi:tRNA nucleotidyltransferase/poly(A) polymerase